MAVIALSKSLVAMKYAFEPVVRVTCAVTAKPFATAPKFFVRSGKKIPDANDTHIEAIVPGEPTKTKYLNAPPKFCIKRF